MSIPHEEHGTAKYIQGFPEQWRQSRPPVGCMNCETYATLDGVIVGYCLNCAFILGRGDGFRGLEDMETIRDADGWVEKGGEYLRSHTEVLTSIVNDQAREKRLATAREAMHNHSRLAPIYVSSDDEDFASEFEAYSLVICQCCGDAIQETVETRGPFCECATPTYPSYCRKWAAQTDYDDDVSSGPDSIS